mmetsp:Transcript_102797/g.265735  ORF Transcript_102797/g.265735 Transcript_102797/m.265735 type:complete len:204 (+) Transcript_102797:1500-2111(+)
MDVRLAHLRHHGYRLLRFLRELAGLAPSLQQLSLQRVGLLPALLELLLEALGLRFEGLLLGGGDRQLVLQRPDLAAELRVVDQGLVEALLLDAARGVLLRELEVAHGLGLGYGFLVAHVVHSMLPRGVRAQRRQLHARGRLRHAPGTRLLPLQPPVGIVKVARDDLVHLRGLGCPQTTAQRMAATPCQAQTGLRPGGWGHDLA